MYKLLLLIPFIFLACSHKPKKEVKTSLEIHQKLKKDINSVMLDDADNDFMDLEANYPSSPYIKSDLLILFLAHLKNEEFDLAKFYLTQYEKRFASSKEIPWCEYQKIKIEFLKYQNAYTNQKELLDLKRICENYKLNFPNSTFLPEVNTIYIKTLLTIDYLNAKIYKLYKQEGKVKAAKMYKTNLPKNSKPPFIPWYKRLFYW